MTKNAAHAISRAIGSLANPERMCIALNEQDLPFLWIPGTAYIGNTSKTRLIFVIDRKDVSGNVVSNFD